MKRKLNVVFLAFISLLFNACEKSILFNGEVTESETMLSEPFQIVELCDNVNVKLKHCDAKHKAGLIHIKTCKNLMDRITTEIEEVEVNAKLGEDSTVKIPFNKLVIQNKNTLNFLRPYDYPLEMTVYYDSIFSLIFNSNGTVTSDTLRGYPFPTDSSENNDTVTIVNYIDAPNLHLEIIGGSGDLIVLTNCYRLKAKYTHGTCNVTLKGLAGGCILNGDYDSHGIIDGKDMEAQWSTISYYGTNTVIAKAAKKLTAKNYNIGSIYYVKYKIYDDTIVYQCPINRSFHGDNIKPYNP